MHTPTFTGIDFGNISIDFQDSANSLSLGICNT
jgi:hypothetical protein